MLRTLLHTILPIFIASVVYGMTLARKLLRLLLFTVLGGAVLSIALVLLLRWVDPPVSALMLERQLTAKI